MTKITNRQLFNSLRLYGDPTLVGAREPNGDAVQESRIAAALERFYREKTPEAWSAFKAEHAKRSPEQVLRMERKKGLR